jgi:endonuclease-8
MPEGDTILKAARILDRALAGKVVTKFEARTAGSMRPPIGTSLSLSRVEAAGKNLLMFFSDGLVLRTHMRMSGSWHLYRHGERWRAPSHAVRVVLETADWVAIAVNVPVIEWVKERELPHHAPVASLGPDVLRDPFDEDEVIRRARLQPSEAIAEILLDQTVLAGIGNVFKSDILFAARVSPFATVSSLTDAQLRDILAIARRQMRANVQPNSVGRATTGRMNTEEKLWVYRRAGLACRICGTTIETARTGPNARSTYWCPACQHRISE